MLTKIVHSIKNYKLSYKLSNCISRYFEHPLTAVTSAMLNMSQNQNEDENSLNHNNNNNNDNTNSLDLNALHQIHQVHNNNNNNIANNNTNNGNIVYAHEYYKVVDKESLQWTR